jgi:hypothetical protein
MKLMKASALACAGMLILGTTHGQTTASSRSMTTSIRDNPGVLGHSFTEVQYSWVDFSRDRGVDADGYIAGARSNIPVARGVDLGLGYNYYRENGHRNPFTGTDFDARYHQLAAGGTLFTPMGAAKPFVQGNVGYQWSRGDIQRLRTYDDMWVWTAGAGVEIPMGLFSLMPRISYSDAFDDNGIGSWHYGGQLHHWFNEQLGGFLDVTFHEPRSNLRPDAWTYTAGVRVRF